MPWLCVWTWHVSSYHYVFSLTSVSCRLRFTSSVAGNSSGITLGSLTREHLTLELSARALERTDR